MTEPKVVLHPGWWWDEPYRKTEAEYLCYASDLEWAWRERVDLQIRDDCSDESFSKQTRAHGWMKNCKLVVPKEFLNV